MAVIDTIVYITMGTSGLRGINVSDPTHPVILRNFAMPGTTYDLVVDGDYIFTAAGDSGIRIVDIHNLDSMAVCGHYSLVNGGNIRHLAKFGNLLLASGDMNYLIFDISTSHTLTLRSNFELYNILGLSFQISGNYLYVASDSAGFAIFNIADLNHPTYIADV